MIDYTTSDNNFDLAPEGWLDFEITKADKYTNPTSGKTTLQTEFNYLDSETLETKKLTDFILLIVSSGDKFRVFSDLLLLAGVQPESKGSVDESKFIGLKGRMRIAHETYKDKTQAKIMELAPLAEKKRITAK